MFLDLLRSETAGDPARLVVALRGLRAYQTAPRPNIHQPKPIAARVGRASLRDYGGIGPPLIMVPSLINPPDVLDLMPGNSLLRHLATGGRRTFLVDWGIPGPEERHLDVAAHVEEILLPLIDSLGEPPLLAGYCLGGTMAIAAATLRHVRGLALLATPWRFEGFPAASRHDLTQLWAQSAPAAAILGLLPMELLQCGFWKLDPGRTIAKYEAYAAMEPDSVAAQGFVALEDWSNAGPPLTEAAARELFARFFGCDDPGTGRWRVGGRAIDPAALTCPVLDVASAKDRIVPRASAAAVGEKIVLDLGHVGMIVGRNAPALLWDPLDRWLSRAVDS